MILNFNSQELLWLYEHVGASNDLGIAVQIHRKLKNAYSTINTAKELHKEADALQIKLQELRQKAHDIEDKLSLETL